MASKETFGFKEFRNSTMQIFVRDSFTGRFAHKGAARQWRNYTVRQMNRSLKKALNKAKSPGHSPFAGGALVRSIGIQKARKKGTGGLISGALTVGVIYGRRQEFEHKSRSFYLARALQFALPQFRHNMLDKGAIQDILVGRRADPKGSFVD